MSNQTYNLFNKKIQNRIQYVNLINLNLKHVVVVAFTHWRRNSCYTVTTRSAQPRSWESGASCEEDQASRLVHFLYPLNVKSPKEPLFYGIPNQGGDVYFGSLIRFTSFVHLTYSDA